MPNPVPKAANSPLALISDASESWVTDSSQRYTQSGAQVTDLAQGSATVLVPAPEGAATLRVVYFFSGKARKGSIADYLVRLCRAHRCGLRFEEVDIMVGGSEHDLLDRPSQDRYTTRMEAGEFDLGVFSPPCGTWSRANWANDDGPAPCRNRAHPWGLPGQLAHQQRRAGTGNEFIHFTLRGVAAMISAETRLRAVCRALIEHPEDLGRVDAGTPASIWQLPETRSLFRVGSFTTVVGNQCQYKGVDRKKPTRLLGSIPGLASFGFPSWPVFDSHDNYKGPLPFNCGHDHKQRMIGQDASGKFYTSPTAAYPPAMCAWIADVAFKDWYCRVPLRGGSSKAGTAARTFPGFKPSFSLPAVTSTDTHTTLRSVVDSPPSTDDGRPGHSSSTRTMAPPEPKPPTETPHPVTEVDSDTEACNKDGIDRPLAEGPCLDKGSQEVETVDWATAETSDEETEWNNLKRPKRGDGWWGLGPPVKPHHKGLPREVVDGGGLPSPGRWPVEQRVLPEDAVVKDLRRALQESLLDCARGWPHQCLKRKLMEISCGKCVESPFGEDKVKSLRRELRRILSTAGYGPCTSRCGDAPQHFEVRLVQGLLEACRDPDAHFCNWWATGVWLGSSERRMPRAPAIFDRKTKWRLGFPEEGEVSEWRPNYSSAVDNAAKVEAQFEAEVKEGLMKKVRLKEALKTFGSQLCIAAIGAIEKKGRTGEVRVIHDASHGVLLNHVIRVRDQVRHPTAADTKAVLAAMADEGGPHFALGYDVRKAHRRIPVAQCDWGRQACQTTGTAAARAELKKKAEDLADDREWRTHGRRATRVPGPPVAADFTEAQLDEEIWVNLVGTFGVASAGYWWGRAGAALVRLAHYLVGRQDATWTMLYSDDGWVTGRTARFERGILLHLLILMVTGTPLAWHKLGGGVQHEWVGYLVDVGRFELGITELRRAWALRWIGDKIREQRVALGELREGLGRLQFVAGPLELIRPFLGPLYSWACAGPKHARPPLPTMILLILKYLHKALGEMRMSPCREGTLDKGEIFRLDAKAEGETVAIGGWLTRGGLKASEAPWFALELTRRSAPWAFYRGEPFRTIASLELLAALVGVLVLLPEEEWKRDQDATGYVTLGCGTDNRGNSFLVDGLMTTKFPLGVVLMELADQLRRRRAVLRANWLPRLQNEEADALTNGDFRHFDPKRRIVVALDGLKFSVLDTLMSEGASYHDEMAAIRAKEKAVRVVRLDPGGPGDQPRQRKRKRAGEALRDRDPW